MDGSLVVVENGTVRLAAFRESPFPEALRKDLKRWISGELSTGSPSRHIPDIADLLAGFEEELGQRLLAEAGIKCRDLDCAGTHGITVRHHPFPHRLDFFASSPDIRGVSYQAANPFALARAFRTPVVSQFRGADVALGGHGAPLAPILHRALFTGEIPRAFLNLGGIANLTGLPPEGSGRAVTAFDTGPGNMLLDLAISQSTQGKEPFDKDGAHARRGRPDPALLDWLLADPFFSLAPPKSTGREEWGEERLRKILAFREDLHKTSGAAFSSRPSPPERVDDLLATLSELTAEGVFRGLKWLPVPPREIIAGGGGVKNRDLVERIARRTGLPVVASDERGFPSQAIESIAFAYLALLSLSGRPGNIPEVTGASGPAVLGQITPPPKGLDPLRLQDIAARADIHLPSPDRPRRRR